MPDIAKCTGVDCPFKEKCHRYTSKPGGRQSYFANPPIKDGRCDYYWGENAEYIWNELKSITGKNNNRQ